MIDFTNIKSITIPQGKVKDISVSGVKVWKEQTTTYTVSGVWVFNDTMKPIHKDNGQIYNINFKSNTFNFIAMEESPLGGAPDFLFYTLSNNSDYKVYDYTAKTWLNTAYKTVDFGTTPQEVDFWFYEWLTANAKKKHKITWRLVNCYTYATLPDYMTEDETLTINIFRDSGTTRWQYNFPQYTGNCNVEIVQTNFDQYDHSVTLSISQVSSDCSFEFMALVAGAEPV